MYWLFRWILFALSVMFVAWLVKGISVDGIWAALIVSIVIGLINSFIRPIIYYISLPINILTLGLFTLVINALLLMFAAYVSPGFTVDGFWSALLGSIILSLLGLGINNIALPEKNG